MSAPAQYDFDTQLRFSNGYSANTSIERILVENIPGATRAYLASRAEDKSGTDWWVEVPSHKISVDVKVRAVDFKPKGQDDLALESWSVLDSKVGWTRDPNKRTDYILWHWLDTGRWCLIPFRMLCAVFEEERGMWECQYKTAIQSSGSWQSQCVFVPRQEVWRAIYEKFGGKTPQQSLSY